MNNYILADYYEELGFVSKAKRLRKHKSLIIFGYYELYNHHLNRRRLHGYNVIGNFIIFSKIREYSYVSGNGEWFR